MTDREKLEVVAASFTNLMELKGAQARTSALLIRTCVKALTREPGPFDDATRRSRIRRDKADAIRCLGSLADMMDPPPVRLAIA